jgi:Leucine-rich repeat (LRR) protein
LNNNNLKTLEILRKCPHLQELEVSGNRLTDAAGIENMDSLNLLKINNNQLTSLRNIPLEKLSMLEARGNNIISLRFKSGIYKGEEFPIYDFANNLIEKITLDDQCGFGGLILRKNYLRDLDWLENALFWRGATLDLSKNPIQLEKAKIDQLWEAGVELAL